MKRLLVLILVAASVGFAWPSLPGLDQAQAPGAPQGTTGGSGVVVQVRMTPVIIAHTFALPESYPRKPQRKGTP